MKFIRTVLVILLASFPFETFSAEANLLSVELGTIEVTAPALTKPGTSETGLGDADLASMRASTSDSARLLQDIPGVSVYGAGGVSGLPVIHGMADDRVNVQVDDMGLMPACPNHMNSALSYIDPTNVGSVKVFAGITPVSVGGDSIGGTIQVNSAPPEFANAGENTLFKGKAGAFFRSNGNVFGGNVAASAASENLNLTYSASSAQARNYTAAADFKAAGSGATGGEWLGGNAVGSTAYTSVNQDIGFALRHEQHLLQLKMGLQHIPYEGFPNQRMDMTANNSTQINLRYSGLFQWGDLDARIYRQDINHKMNMGVDRVTYGSLGMPMDTKAKTFGAMVKGNIIISEIDILRVGIETQNYTLYDWWPQAGGMMGPNTFWNVDFGQRNKLDYFGEWEARWNSKWLTQLGLRSDTVNTDAAAVQGYDNGALWAPDAVTFNALDHRRTDNNWDFTALTSYTPDATKNFEAGYARKSRSPNLYQRYPWSTQPMATLMNNFVGDGNGYVGNVNLSPEVAHTFSGTGDWHDADMEIIGLKATGYFTYIQGYIDAQRCNFGQCGGSANVNATTGFLNLTYVNQSVRLYGIDVSGHALLGSYDHYGKLSVTGVLNYVRGTNLSTGDNLYNIMPLNTKLALTERLGGWSNTAEFQLVAAKTEVSQVRNEVQTGAYNLINLRSSYEWKQARLDIAIENLFNRYYSMPLGGVYVGQGASMAINGIPWGVAVPGMGRSINTALSVRF